MVEVAHIPLLFEIADVFEVQRENALKSSRPLYYGIPSDIGRIIFHIVLYEPNYLLAMLALKYYPHLLLLLCVQYLKLLSGSGFTVINQVHVGDFIIPDKHNLAFVLGRTGINSVMIGKAKALRGDNDQGLVLFGQGITH